MTAKSVIVRFPLKKIQRNKNLPLPPKRKFFSTHKMRRALIFLRKCTRKEIFSCVRKTRSQNRNRIFFTIFGAFRLVVPARLPSPTRRKSSFFRPSRSRIFGTSNLRASRICLRFPRHTLPPRNCQCSLAPKHFLAKFQKLQKKGGAPLPPPASPPWFFEIKELF